MNIYYLKITLIIYISPYKTKAHENITINPENCQTALLSHESALSTFFKAIREDDTDELLTFKNMNWDLYTSYQNDRILLHYAAILGKAQAIDILVSELEIDVNIQEPETGRTALHHAVLNIDPSSRLDTIYILITLGANVLALDNEGYRASQYVEDNKKPYHFKYSEEQKKKTVELTLPPYNIIRRELLKLLQLPYTTVSDWVNQHRKDHNLKTRRQDFQEKKTRVIHLITTENMTQKQAAEEVGVSKNTVSDWMKQYREEHNVPTKQPRHPSQEERNKAIEMFNSGMNAAEIARVLGKSPRTVRDWLQPYNAQARQELHERAMEMFQSSLSVSEISTILEKSTRTIRSWLQSHNTQIRQRLKNKAIKMYKAGISIPEIAKTLQASTHTISNWVHPYKNKYKRYSQRFRDHAAKMFIEYGIGKEAIIDVLNIHISIRTLNIWIGHYKERKQKEETETTSQETNELQDDDSEESDFDQSNDFYSEVDAAIAIVERNLSLRDITEIANKNYFNLELLKLYVRNYRYR